MPIAFGGEAANNSSDDQRSSEKYQAGARARHNLSTQNFLFAQGSWLSDRYNGDRSRDTLVAGYGRQVLTGPIHTLRVEAGSGVRHDEYQGGGNFTKALGYAAASYSYQLTDNTKFIQGLSLLANNDTTVNSETGLNVDINDHFALKVAYNVTWNQNPPDSAPKHTDTKTSVSLIYIPALPDKRYPSVVTDVRCHVGATAPFFMHHLPPHFPRRPSSRFSCRHC